jgi:ABC-type multidrug transport system fused ATPase/permease subunit
MHYSPHPVYTIRCAPAAHLSTHLPHQGFSTLAGIWLNTKQTLIAAGRFLELMEREPLVAPSVGRSPGECRGCLELRGVGFAYPIAPQIPVLRGLSFRVEPGSVVALVGASGAGKSTVGRLMERFYDPQEGQLLLDGVPYADLELRWLRRQIGLVEQEPVLFDRSIAENIAYGRPETSRGEVVQAARRVNAHAFIEELPEGYDSRPGEKGVRVSGGQKQRVAIARALAKEPKLLLLDEATSALDSTNEAAVQAALEALMAGRSTVVIAHRLSTVVRATQIIVLDKGVAVESGTHDELMS